MSRATDASLSPIGSNCSRVRNDLKLLRVTKPDSSIREGDERESTDGDEIKGDELVAVDLLEHDES